MQSQARTHRHWIGYTVAVLVAALILDAALEFGRANAALQAWICGTTPTPGGAGACQTSFVLRWVTGRLPLYTVVAGAAALVVSVVWDLAHRASLSGESVWARLVRVVVVVICLIMFAELVACAGDATCGLSVSCS